MKCDMCKMRDAVVFIQQVTDGAAEELHLCMECAREKGLSTHNGKIEMPLNSLFSTFQDKRTCSVCGQSVDDIRKHRKVGCPQCYSEFAPEIKAIFYRNGFEKPYTGSLPQKLSGYRSVLKDRAVLQVKLDESVAKEDYEKAVVYRNKLRELDKKNG